MKRIKLTHGTARVSDNVTKETIEALNKLSEIAYNYEPKQCDIHVVVKSLKAKYPQAFEDYYKDYMSRPYEGLPDYYGTKITDKDYLYKRWKDKEL